MRNKILGLFSVLLGFYLLFSSSKSIFHLWQAGKRVEFEKQKLEEEIQKNKELKRKLSEILSEEYIEKIAREELGLAREGEKVIILPPRYSSPESKAPSPTPKKSNLEKWKSLFF